MRMHASPKKRVLPIIKPRHKTDFQCSFLEKFELILKKIVNVLARPASGGARNYRAANAAPPKKSARTNKIMIDFVSKKNAKILKNFY